MIQSLPSELRCLIVELSSGSPRSLAALAQTHTSYQREAERVLYDTLFIFSANDNSLKCMETLATNPEKAALVHLLTVKYITLHVHENNININRNQRVTTYLSKSLINMHSLSDFRVISCLSPFSEVEAQMIQSLGKILWSVCRILIFTKLTILLAKQSESLSIANFLLPWPSQESQHF